MILIKPIVIIFSLLSFISCGDTDTSGTSRITPKNRVYLKVANNTTSDISYQRDSIYCELGLNFDDTEFQGSPECNIYENDSWRVDFGEKYWGTDIPPISSATLKPSESTTSYGDLGNTTKTGYSGFANFASFIITVTIGDVSKKIVGFNEELYRKLFYDKPPEFFHDVISYGTFYGASLNSVETDEFKYNPCWVGANTALTEYAKSSINTRYYFDISIKGIDNIEISLDKTKSRIGDSGYDKATDTCKFYIDEDVLLSEEDSRSIFPFTDEDYDNVPKDLTERIYIITEPSRGFEVIRYGSDPQ